MNTTPKNLVWPTFAMLVLGSRIAMAFAFAIGNIGITTQAFASNSPTPHSHQTRANPLADPLADPLANPPPQPIVFFKRAECEIGVYRFDSPDFLIITKRAAGYQYSYSDGRVGMVDDPDSDVKCGDAGRPALLAPVAMHDGQSLHHLWWKVPNTVTNTQFKSGDVMLSGRLIEPPDANASTPLVTFAHGSERFGWIGSVRDPYQMVARGISVFVFDKRGTGQSEGVYTQNFPRLADDLVAASKEAKRLAVGRYGRFGIFGYSQGGWIAPMAATRAGADFIGVGYGLVLNFGEEEDAEIELALREAGYDEDVVAKGQKISQTVTTVLKSGYTQGLDDLEEIQRLYSNEPWFPLVRGDYTGLVLSTPVEEIRSNGIPEIDEVDFDPNIDAIEVIRSVNAPQLWVLAMEDREAPVGLTLERLQNLRSEGKNIGIYTFPDTDHGIWEFNQAPDGSRDYTKVSDGYYDLMADWAKGELNAPYGKSTFVPPRQ